MYSRERVPVVGRLVRAVVEDLEELRPPQMKHELRIEREVLGQQERLRVVLLEDAKLLTLQKQQQ